MSNLTTRVRFKRYANITGTAQDSLIDFLIPMVSGSIERYLRRTLASTTYKTWFNGTGCSVLRVIQYPVTAIYLVSISSNTVGRISNTDTTIRRATVSFDGINVVLVAVTSAGVDSITVLPVSTYPTLLALRNHINTLSGWSCTLDSSTYEAEPAAFLRPVYGQNAQGGNSADLIVPNDSTSTAKIENEDMVSLVQGATFPTSDIFPFPSPAGPWQYGSGFPLGPSGFFGGAGFPAGVSNIFIWYTAGYTLPTDNVAGNLPDGLTLIVHQILQDVLSSTKINSNLTSESIDDYSYSLRANANGSVGSAVENRKRDLNLYRRVSI